MNRREFLEQLGLCTGAGWLLAACGPDSSSTANEASYCSGAGDRPPSDWVEVRLDEHPELNSVGGWIEVDRPEDFLEVHVVHYRHGCYLAASRLCTHGACELDVSEVDVVADGAGLFACPCHGSQFGPDGRVVSGPATDPLSSFEIIKVEESLWIRPPQIG